MNKNFIKIFIISITSLFLSSCGTMESVVLKPGYDFSQIKRIAVLDFNDVSYYRNAGPMASQLFVKYFLNTNYNIIERSEIDAILREHNLAISGALNVEQIKQYGKICGVDAFITGTVTLAMPETTVYERDGYIRYVPAQVGLTCRMFSVETGEILWAASNTYDALDIQTAFEYLVSSLVQNFVRNSKIQAKRNQL
jgi:hypothetical protein